MPNNISQVDLTGLSATAGHQGEAIEAGRAQFRTMVSQAEALAASWGGKAAVEFQNGLGVLVGHGNTLFNALQTMQNLMQQTHNDFEVTHEDTTRAATDNSTTVANAAPTGLVGL